MTPKDGAIRVELKRADVAELVLKHELLRACPLVVALGDRAAAILGTGVGRRYPEGTTIFHQGQAGDSVFLVLRGEVRLTRSQDQAPVELGVAGQGDVFGESELLAPKERACSAYAGNDVDAVELSRAKLLQRGQLPMELHAFLTDVQTQRRKAQDELSQFLDRW